MKEEVNLPEGLQLAVKLLAQIGDDESDRAISYVHDLAEERDQRLTLQHHAADQAQRIADLIAESEAKIPEMQAALQDRLMLDRANRGLMERIAELEAERDELRARLTEIESQEPVAFSKGGNLFWVGNPQDYRGVDCNLYARPVPVIPDGWRLVPVEPTPEMIEAGKYVKRRRLLAAVEAVSAGKRHNPMAQAMAVNEEWSAMIAAAPEAER